MSAACSAVSATDKFSLAIKVSYEHFVFKIVLDTFVFVLRKIEKKFHNRYLLHDN